MPFWYNGWLVALADILAGCLVLTSLARQDVKHTSAALIAVRETCRMLHLARQRPAGLCVHAYRSRIGNTHRIRIASGGVNEGLLQEQMWCLRCLCFNACSMWECSHTNAAN